ncbi:hypothetical protein ACRC7T_06485 [Segnochrobactraceae bacterium EtOH-i3]
MEVLFIILLAIAIMYAAARRRGQKRRHYNGAVDGLLVNSIHIKTRDNEKFPRVGAYLEMLDDAYKAGMNQFEAAAYIAVLYYCGLEKHGFHEEALDVYLSIHEFIIPIQRGGGISLELWSRLTKEMNDAKNEPPF